VSSSGFGWMSWAPFIKGDIMLSAVIDEPATIQRTGVTNLLVLDDERAVREGCREVAINAGFNAFTAENAEQAYRLLDTQSVDAVLLDLRLPGATGLEVLHQIRQRKPDAVIVVITGYATVQSAVQAMKAGAFEYMTKPFSMDELRGVLQRVSTELQGQLETHVLRERMTSKAGFGMLVGESPDMEKLYRIIAKAAQSSHPVLILGESGTGKELVARSIHAGGPLRDKPFIPVDCGSLVPTLIESELFGYAKGAFTGANKAKEGLLEVGEGGTVFLDEIGELPVDLQAKLLRAIQEKEIRPVGSTRTVPINVRILAATNRDLEVAVAEGKFRRDLYYRLNVLTLRIPPLRERKGDVPVLVQHFLDRMANNTGIRRTISDEALKALTQCEWPGNVRELENCMERACTMSSGPVLHTADMPTLVQYSRQQNAAAASGSAAKVVPLADLEKQAILSTIEKLNGDKLTAAKLLGIGKTTLYRKLKEYGVHV
jgi:DNA-binding NtrC family response regulator